MSLVVTLCVTFSYASGIKRWKNVEIPQLTVFITTTSVLRPEDMPTVAILSNDKHQPT